MRSHGARCRRGSSWPTTTSTRGARRRGGLVERRARAPARPASAASAGAASSALAGEADASRPQTDRRTPRRAGAARRARAERAGRSTTWQHCRSGAPRRRARTGRESAALFALMSAERAPHNAFTSSRAASCTPPRPRQARAPHAEPIHRCARLPGPGAAAALRAPAPDRQQHRQRRHAGLRGPRHGLRASAARRHRQRCRRRARSRPATPAHRRRRAG